MVHKIYKIILHLLVILNYVSFLLYKESIKDELHRMFPTRIEFGGSWKFLTHWNIFLQLAYFNLAFFNDIFGTESSTKEASSRLQKCRDFLFSTMAFPVGIFVPIIFWILFNIDRNLVFPPSFDKVFPPMTNHMMHTTPLPSQILELCMAYHIYPPKTYGIPAIITFCLSYIGWIFYIAYAGGFWVYPIFEVLTPLRRVCFVILLGIFVTMLYLIGERCNSWVWKVHKNTNVQTGVYKNGTLHQERSRSAKKYT